MSDQREVMTIEEAADFMRMSVSWLQESDVPRATLGRRIVFLRSQCLLYIEKRLTHRLDAQVAA